VAKYDKLLSRILRGASDANIAFEDLRHLLKRLGFAERIHGDHYIFTKVRCRGDFESATKGLSSQTLPGETGASRDREVSAGRRRR
jgi:hypothetical protein